MLRSALLDLARPSNSESVDVSDVILTHRHHDHTHGLPSVLRLLRQLWDERNPGASARYTPPRIHKFPLPAASLDKPLEDVISNLSVGLFQPASPDSRVHDLTDGQILAPVDGLPITVIHTPGHTPDSICLRLGADGPLFTGDTVLGGSTSVFEELAPYLASLRRILDGPAPLRALYPGHGPVEEDGHRIVDMYIKHRLEREVRILDVLKKAPSTGDGLSAAADPQWTVWSIVQTMYKGYPENLWEAAAGSVILHLRKLADEGKVRALGGEGKDSAWILL